MIALAHEAIAPGEGHERGRALLRQLYFAHRGMEMPEIVLEERGKPRFVEDPIHFSITHTPHHVFCAISDRQWHQRQPQAHRLLPGRPQSADHGRLPGGSH